MVGAARPVITDQADMACTGHEVREVSWVVRTQGEVYPTKNRLRGGCSCIRRTRAEFIGKGKVGGGGVQEPNKSMAIRAAMLRTTNSSET